MKSEQFEIPYGTRVDRNTGLKATALTSILAIQGCGRLLAIYAIDPDDATQNERLLIGIDGNVVLDDAAWDCPNTDFWVQLLASIAKNAVTGGTSVNTTSGGHLDAKIGIPFEHSLEVEYLRAAAGATGLTIHIVYCVMPDIVRIG